MAEAALQQTQGEDKIYLAAAVVVSVSQRLQKCVGGPWLRCSEGMAPNGSSSVTPSQTRLGVRHTLGAWLVIGCNQCKECRTVVVFCLLSRAGCFWTRQSCQRAVQTPCPVRLTESMAADLRQAARQNNLLCQGLLRPRQTRQTTAHCSIVSLLSSTWFFIILITYVPLRSSLFHGCISAETYSTLVYFCFWANAR